MELAIYIFGQIVLIMYSNSFLTAAAKQSSRFFETVFLNTVKRTLYRSKIGMAAKWRGCYRALLAEIPTHQFVLIGTAYALYIYTNLHFIFLKMEEHSALLIYKLKESS